MWCGKISGYGSCLYRETKKIGLLFMDEEKGCLDLGLLLPLLPRLELQQEMQSDL